MLGRRGPEQYEFFAGSLRELFPDEHVLARVDRVLDLSWLRDEVAGLYSAEAGRPSIDPEAAVRLMLAGFLLGLVHDRRLMREAAVNVAIRWFARFGLADALPDHSSLTRIRQRWGAARFRRIFECTVTACVAAGIAKGEVVHLDATLIRADVSWEPIRSPVPMRRFRYDARHDRLTCPRGKTLKAGRRVKHGRFFTARAKDCRRCDLARLCLSGGRVNKAVVVGDDYPALLRARRRRDRWSDQDMAVYARHRWRVEGVHGEAKTRHGLARAVRRGLTNIRIQVYLTAAAINLKRLAAAVAVILCAFVAILIGPVAGAPRSRPAQAPSASV